MISRENKVRCVVALCVVACSVLIVAFGFTDYPAPHGNSVLFVPAAITFARGGGLVNEISHVAQWIDATGSYRFLTYPPLFPLALASVMPVHTSHGAFIVLAFLEVLVIALSALALVKAVRLAGKRLDWLSALFIVLALAVIAAPFQSLSTRSDILFQLLLLAAMFAAYRLLDTRRLWLALGALLGVAAATHPMYVVMLAALTGMCIAFRHPPRRALGECFKAFGLGLVVFVVIMTVTPFGFAEKMHGITTHSGVYGGGGWFWFGSGENQSTFGAYMSDFISRFFTNPVSFCSGALFLLFVIVGVRAYKRYRKDIKSPLLFAIFTGLFGVTLLTVVARPVSIYYFQMLSPLVIAFILYEASRAGSGRAAKAALVLVLCAMSVGFMRQAALFPYYLKDGVRLDAARAAYEELKPADCVKRCMGLFSTGLWPLSEDYGAMFTSTQAARAGKRLENTVGVALLQQEYSGLMNPPEKLKGCALEKDLFVKKIPKLFGVRLANTWPGYGFAAYRCGAEEG